MSHKSNIILLLLFLCFWQSIPAQQTASVQETMLYNVSESFLQQLIDTAKKNYPRLHAFNKRIENAEQEVKRAKAGWFDAFNFSYLYSPNNTTTIVDPNLLNGYQVGMFVNVGSLMKRPAEIKKAKTDIAINKAERDEYILNITALVKQRYYLYLQAISILQLKAQSLTDVETTVQQVKYKYEKGEETLEAYNKNVVAYEDRIEGKIQAESALLIAKSNLEELLETKLENIR